jgi:uncharacterized protein DUF3455
MPVITGNRFHGVCEKMTSIHRITAGLAIAALAAIGAGTAAGAEPTTLSYDTQRQIPEAVRVPEGSKRIAVMESRGVQTYQCVNGVWTFLQPDAILENHGRPEVLHSKGPVWTDIDDGSSVTGAVQGSSSVANAVPQLLLRATSNRGPGFLGEVDFIQRLRTAGGVSPTGSCAEGVTASVPYTADYAFWVKK